MSLPFFRFRRFGAALIALAAACGGAEAADLFGGRSGVRGYAWQGPYVGANLGYQWGITTNNPTRPSGVAGGFQGGYNFQNGAWVFGAEADIQMSTADDRFAPWQFSNPWFGTVRGRMGFAMNNVMFYGTGGLAYGSIEAQSTTGGAIQKNTSTGFAIGGGMEVGLTRNWSLRTEYLYVDLGDRPYSVTGTNNGLEFQLLRFGVNYRF